MGGGMGSNFGNTKGSKSNYQIHQGRQNKHIVGTNNYRQQIANGKNPSILTANAARLLKEGAGTGRMITDNKEAVDFGRIIGRYYDKETSSYYDTTRGTIHYDSSNNAHIVPARPNSF